MIRSWKTRLVARLLSGVAVLGVFCAAATCQAEVTGPSQTDRQVTLAITSLLRKAHLTRHQLDDEISRRWLDNFIKTLDPMKVYFTQADIDSFARYATELDNLANKGDIAVAHTIYKTFLKRVDDDAKLAEELVKEKHDFTVQESMGSDPKTAKFATTAEEVREIWRKRIKYDLLVLTNEGKTYDEAVDKLTRRYRSFSKRMHQTTNDELLEMYLTAMTSSFDPHTSYMSPETLENFRIQMALQLDGIGAALRFEDGYTIVSEIVPGGAASREGHLKPEDRVTAVGQGETGELEEVVEMKLSDVVARIRGKRGTVVRMEVIPAGKTEKVVYSITRDKIELKGSEARGEIIEAGQKPDGTPYKIGVINLPSFYMDMVGAQAGQDDFKSTTRDVLKILEDPQTGFKAKGVDALIMDLRMNGGGSLSEAIRLTGLFIDRGPVVQVKDWEGTIEQHEDEEAGLHWDKPLVVLSSKFSASASEIFAGAIQDYNRGLVIGDKTSHGKGTVQSLLDIGNTLLPGPNSPKLGALKLTMQQFYRPNGESTQKHGVAADVELPSVINQMDVGEVDLDYAVPFDKIEPSKFKDTGYVSDSIRNKLAVLSSQRVQQSTDFQKVDRDIKRYLERKQRKSVTLNEAEFKKEREDLEIEKKAEPEEPKSYDRPVVEQNFYFNEALQVTLDLLRLTTVAKK